MKITSSDEVKIRVLETLAESKEELSYYALRKKTNLSINTFLNNTLFLDLMGLIDVKKMKSPAGNVHRFVTINSKGVEALKRVKEYKKSIPK